WGSRRRRDAQPRAGREAWGPPRELEFFELRRILKPYSEPVPRRGSGRVVARPSIAAGAKYEVVSRAYIRAVHSVLKGETTAEKAASALEEELVAITGFPKRAPRD